MSRLSKLYQAIETLRDEGLKLSPEQEAQFRETEQDIIQTEIIPELAKNMEPILSQLKCDALLIVDYVSGTPLKVSLSRKNDDSDLGEDYPEFSPDPQVEHRTVGPQLAKKDGIAEKTRLRVSMPHGSVIEFKSAKETFVETIRRIGVARVRQLGLKFCGVPIVSNSLDSKYGKAQVPVEGGWLILTHSSTLDKKKQLDRIAEVLHIPIKVEIIS